MSPQPAAAELSGEYDTPAAVAAAPKTRVLIVEDDPGARLILSKILSIAGYATESAEHGLMGWEMAQALRPDIIISDWMMPRMDGRELCERVKSDPELRSTYFILLTAKDLSQDKITGLDAGADEYLVKPYEPMELTARLRAAERILTLQRILVEKNREIESAMDRISRELAVTSQIQRSLLPHRLPEFSGYAFATHYRPSTECSGDYYDLIDLGQDRFGIIIADVSGHGTPAMVAMAVIRSLVRLYALETQNPAELLVRLNRTLYDQLPTSQYITAFYAICEASTGRIQYSSAGHRPPLLIRGADGSGQFLEHCEGFPLKLVTPKAQYSNFECSISPGDGLLLYTDGIPEACDPDEEPFDTERLRQAALEATPPTAEALVANVVRALDEFIQCMPLEDDVSMLAVSRLPAGPSGG